MVPTGVQGVGSVIFPARSRSKPFNGNSRHLSRSSKDRNAHRPVVLIAGSFALLTACLLTGLLACIVLEALDGDLDLWPFGAEDFNVTASDQPLMGSQLLGGILALTVVLRTLMTAGAYLVLRHRARSALASDGRSTFSLSLINRPGAGDSCWRIPWHPAISF